MKLKKIASVFLAAMLVITSTGCSGSEKKDTVKNKNVVNVGCTSSIATLNPLLIGGSWIEVYGIGLEFLPLVEPNEDMEFENVLVDSISSKDDLTYTVKLKDNAKWSDGVPITAEDIEFTLMRMASPHVMGSILLLSEIEGSDDVTGGIKEGAKSVSGLKVVDEKTIDITFKNPINMTRFLNGYAQYIMPIPKHVLKDVDEKDIAKSDWFNHPTVVSGPYKVVEHDADHFITYKANEKYFKGEPKIENLNFKIVDPSQILSNLESGEIDIVPPFLGAIPENDYEAVRKIKGLKTSSGLKVTTETLFLNGETIKDKKVRQAMLCSIDREKIAKGLLGKDFDLMDGFCVPEGPLYGGLKPVEYDKEKAEKLLKEASFDKNKTISVHIDSGNSSLKKAAILCQNYWEQVGIKSKIITENLETVVAGGGSEGFDIVGVSYTYPVTDPSFDIDWVLNSWCHTYTDDVKEKVNTIWTAKDFETQKKAYNYIDEKIQDEAVIIPIYAHGPMGVIRESLKNAKPKTYGFASNIEEWTFK